MAENPNSRDDLKSTIQNEVLGDPTPKWKINLAKVGGALGILGGAFNTVTGIASIFRGGTVEVGNVQTSVVMDARLYGTIKSIIGAAGLAIGKATLDSAKGADKARNYLQLSQTLDAARNNPQQK
jgi:hypothetical protein